MSGGGDRDELLDLLYGEGDDTAAARVQGDEALAAELEGFRQVRALYASLPEEDPPAALSAQLLAAAAEQAEAAARPGLVERLRAWLAPIAQHPGLAAAASLLLVAGVAGALYVTGGAELAPTGARSKAPAPETAPAPASAAGEPAPLAETRGGGAQELAASEEAGAEAAADVGDVDKDRDEAEARRTRGSGGRPPGNPRRSRRSADRGVVGGSIADEGSGAGALQVDRRPPAPPRQSAGTTATTTSDAPAERREAQASPSAPPPAAEPARSEASAPAGAGPAKRAPARKAAKNQEQPAPRQESAGEAAALHRRAREAAGAGECATVVALGRRIRKLDPSYHTKVFVRDDALRDCLARK